MRTGYSRGLSARELESVKEFREFVKAEAEAARLKEDQQQYRLYCEGFCDPHTPEGLRPKALDFSEFRKLMPDESDAAVRGQVATFTDLKNRIWRRSQDLVKNTSLPDVDLFALGFDLSVRTDDPMADFGEAWLREQGAAFRAECPSYHHQTHSGAVVEFLSRHRLQPNKHNLAVAFEVLTLENLLPQEPPEPERSPELNQYGVNLHVAPDPEFDRQQARKQRRHDYFNKVVKVDELTKTEYTEAMLDQLSADDYKVLMLGKFRTPTISDVISGTVK